MNRRSRLLVPLAGALVAALALPSSPSVALGPGGRPDQMGMLTIDAANVGELHVDWDGVDGASKYIIEIGNETMSDRIEIGETTNTDAWIVDLVPGKVYCVQVHGWNANGHGKRGGKTCKPSIIAQGPNAGPSYRVVTYNVCSVTCGGWNGRRAKAVRLLKAAAGDVVGLQEDKNKSKLKKKLKKSLAVAVHHGINTLMYNQSRFTVVRKGVISLGADRREAVWADLADNSAGGKRVLWVNTHLANEKSSAGRANNMDNLLSKIAGISNGLPVVFMGDMNSFRHRGDDVPANRFNNAGYYDAYDLAMSLSRPNYNSFNGFKIPHNISQLYGDHVDRFFVKPGTSRVLSWANAAWINGNLAPYGSDHSPMVINLQVN